MLPQKRKLFEAIEYKIKKWICTNFNNDTKIKSMMHYNKQSKHVIYLVSDWKWKHTQACQMK